MLFPCYFVILQLLFWFCVHIDVRIGRVQLCCMIRADEQTGYQKEDYMYMHELNIDVVLLFCDD